MVNIKMEKGIKLKSYYITVEQVKRIVDNLYNKEKREFEKVNIVLYGNRIQFLRDEKYRGVEKDKGITLVTSKVLTLPNGKKASKEKIVKDLQGNMNYRLQLYASYKTLENDVKFKGIIQDIYKVSRKNYDSHKVKMTPTGLKIVKEQIGKRVRGIDLAPINQFYMGIKDSQTEQVQKNVIYKNIMKVKNAMEEDIY